MKMRFLFFLLCTIEFCYCQNDTSIVQFSTYEALDLKAPVHIAALGRVAKYGDLYDCRSEKFLPMNIFKKKLDDRFIVYTDNSETKMYYTVDNSLKGKLDILDISASLKVSVMSGFVTLEGSGKYLKDTKKSERSAKATLINSIETKHGAVSLTDDAIKPLLSMDTLKNIDATHVVIGIQWGGRVFVTVEDSNQENKDTLQIEGELKAKVQKLAWSVSGKASVNYTDITEDKLEKFNFEMYGDVLPDTVPQTIIEAVEFMRDASSKLGKANSGKGKPVKYFMFPIKILRELFKADTAIDTVVGQVQDELVQQSVDLFDQINILEQKINDIKNDVDKFGYYLDEDKMNHVHDLADHFMEYKTRVVNDLSENLLLARSNKPNDLHNVIQHGLQDPFWKEAHANLMKEDELLEEISFLKMLQSAKILALGKNSFLHHYLWENFKSDIYVLFYDIQNPDDTKNAVNIIRKMVEKRSNYGPDALFVAVNKKMHILDEYLMKLAEKPRVVLFKNGVVSVEDYSISAGKGSLGDMNEIQKMIMDIKHGLVPVGSTYMQLPFQKSPSELWEDAKWTDITATYKGAFFRVKGPKTENWLRNEPTSASPPTYEFKLERVSTGEIKKDDLILRQWPPYDDMISPYHPTDAPHLYDHNYFFMEQECPKDGGIYPENMAVKIWKRTE